MDKTRIEEAANYANENHKKIGLRTAAQLGFYAGADWASDTTWRDSTKEMPEESVFVLGILERPYIEPTYILTQNVGGQFTMKGITYWCPLPYFSKPNTDEE